LKKDLLYFNSKNKNWMCQECRKSKPPIIV
jgi:hypothetical protein